MWNSVYECEFDIFPDFYEKEVLARINLYPNSLCLNGSKGDYRGHTVRRAGFFAYGGRIWWVNDNSWFKPLDLAYSIWPQYPFKLEPPTECRKQWCLILVDSLQRKMDLWLVETGKGQGFKYMYIFGGD
jgi:hypothetical protein